MKTFIGYISLPFILVSLHWLIVRFYAGVCVPDSLYGYLTSYLTTASPVCVYALTLVEKTSSLYLSSWVFLTVSTVGVLRGIYKKITGPNQVKRD